MQLCSCYQPFIITSRAETSHKKASFCLKFRSSSSYVNCSISVRHMPYRCPPYAVHMSGLCRTRVWLMPDTYDVKHIKTGTVTTYTPVRVKNQWLCQLLHSDWPENGCSYPELAYSASCRYYNDKKQNLNASYWKWRIISHVLKSLQRTKQVKSCASIYSNIV